MFAQVTIGPWIDNGFYYDFDMQGDVLDQVILNAPSWLDLVRILGN